MIMVQLQALFKDSNTCLLTVTGYRTNTSYIYIYVRINVEPILSTI